MSSIRSIAVVGCAILLVVATFAWCVARSRPAKSDPTRKIIEAVVVSSPADWDQRAAARYLDERQAWWMGWQVASREHDTTCVSCHTTLTYMLARPALARTLGENAPSSIERKTLDSVRKRVQLWQILDPYYKDSTAGPHKSTESRATEAVLNAFLLSAEDSRHGILTAETRTAFANMWNLQITGGDDAGAWPWLQFGLEPWESRDSVYFGASLAALAVGLAPKGYATTPEIQKNLAGLRGFINRKLPEQSTLNSLNALWASSKLPGLLTSNEKAKIIQAVLSKQQSDGGWNLSSMLWTWRSARLVVHRWRKSDWTPQESQSDGLATGMVCYVLEESGVPRDDPKLSAGLAWLARSQDKKEGFWTGYSPNRRRDPASGVGRFMTDAATGFATLALTDNYPRIQ